MATSPKRTKRQFKQLYSFKLRQRKVFSYMRELGVRQGIVLGFIVISFILGGSFIFFSHNFYLTTFAGDLATVSIVTDPAPVNGLVPDTFIITVNAQASVVGRIRIDLDSRKTKVCDFTEAPYQCSYEVTPALPAGVHTITANAFKKVGGNSKGSAELQITVANNLPPTPGTLPPGGPGSGDPVADFPGSGSDQPLGSVDYSSVRVLDTGPLTTEQALYAATLKRFQGYHIRPPQPSLVDDARPNFFVRTAYAQEDDCNGVHLSGGVYLMQSQDDVSNLHPLSGQGNVGFKGFFFPAKSLQQLYKLVGSDLDIFHFLAACGQFNPRTGVFSSEILQNGFVACIAEVCAHEYVHQQFESTVDFQSFTTYVWNQLSVQEKNNFLSDLKWAGYGKLNDETILSEFIAFIFQSTGMTFDQAKQLFGSGGKASEDSASISYTTAFGKVTFSKNEKTVIATINDGPGGKPLVSQPMTMDDFHRWMIQQYHDIKVTIDGRIFVLTRTSSPLGTIYSFAIAAKGNKVKSFTNPVTVRGTAMSVELTATEIKNFGWKGLLPQGGTLLFSANDQSLGWAALGDLAGRVVAFSAGDTSVPGLPAGTMVRVVRNSDGSLLDANGAMRVLLPDGSELRMNPGASSVITQWRNFETGETFTEINGNIYGSNDGRIINPNDGWGGNNPYTAGSSNPFCGYAGFAYSSFCQASGAGGGGGSAGSDGCTLFPGGVPFCPGSVRLKKTN